MRLKRLITVSVCAMALLKGYSVQAADDVYVDLSVLNNLQPGDSLFVETQPLFPVVEKAPVKKTTAKKKHKKQKPEKKQESVVKVEVLDDKPAETAIVIAPQAPEIPQPLAEEKQLEPVVSQEIISDELSVIPQDEPEDKREDVAVVTLSATEEQTAPVEEESTTEVTSEEVQPNSEENVVPAPTDENVMTSDAEPSNAQPLENAQAGEPTVSEEEARVDETVTSESTEAENVIQPLIPETPAEPQPETDGQIYFEDDSFAISPENAEKIISLINSFEDPAKHKIAIYAYNFDNGENSFKKKKLSLDRATEIRSLLLNKGYKNFSIKVINVTDDADKRNLVEIEEIK